MNDLFFQFCDITVIKIGSDDLNRPSALASSFFHGLYHGKRSYFCYFCENIFIMRRCDLRAVFPVYFVSVVFSRVMACGNHNTGNTAEFRTAKESSGVGRRDSNTYVLMPFAFRQSAASRQIPVT